jgi:hypothetical protein
MEKRYLWEALRVFVVVMLVTVLSEEVGYPVLFWFVGGALFGLSGQLFLMPREKRTAVRFVLAIVLTAVAAAAAAGIFQIVWA